MHELGESIDCAIVSEDILSEPLSHLLCQHLPLKEAIANIVATYASNNARVTVRPSGTSDVVRVYAEAKTQEQADALALEVYQAVHDHAGGTNDRPENVTQMLTLR